MTPKIARKSGNVNMSWRKRMMKTMSSLYDYFHNLAWQYKMLLLILLWNIVDFLTTKIMVDKLGYEVEYNPMLYFAMVFFNSVWVILIVKIIIIGMAWGLVYKFYEHEKHRYVKAALWIALLGGISISIYNYVGVYLTWSILG